MTYLLRCGCGKNIPVEVGQAGERVRCACGTELEVPTMLGFSRLERAKTDSVKAPGAAAWGARHRFLLLGSTIIALGLVLAGFFFWRLRPPPYEQLDYPPLVALDLWNALRRGVDHPQFRFEEPYEDALRVYRQWTSVAAAVTLIGLAMVAASLLVGRRRPGRRLPHPGSPP